MTTTEYFYNGDILAGQKTGNKVMLFLYDETGDYFGFTYEGHEYYYVKNAQNDVIGIATNGGWVVAHYFYDAWGNVTIKSDTGYTIYDIPGHPAADNPIRYRSYYYDTETQWYFLTSRYYSPAIQRFLNADGYAQTGQGMLDKNMFAYCLNSPVNMTDDSGTLPFFAITAAFGAVAGAVIGGVVAARSGSSVWAGIGIGAVTGGLVGAGLGAAAGMLLAGSATATTAAVVSGAGMFATAVSTGGLGTGAALMADNLSRSVSNTSTVLYSGGNQAFQAAKNFARSSRGVLIDDTKIGELASTISKMPEADFTKVWSQASAAFCNQANGTVNVFISNNAYRGTESIFWSVEMPTLLNNPRVSEIIIHIFE